jgi:ankyrin repeat protein
MSVNPRTQSLFDAIATTNYTQVKRAIDSGAAVNSLNDRGQTPLAVAHRQGNLEIIELLVASGAKMEAQSDRNMLQSKHGSRIVPIPGDWNFQSVEHEIAESPVRDRDIAYEDLIELTHQPNQLQANESDKLKSIGGNQLSNPPTASITPPTPGQNLNSMAAAWQHLDSDPEATYTFDLDEVFAANDRSPNADDLANLQLSKPSDMFEEEPAMTSLNQPASKIDWNEGETYAFDLEADLDRLSIGEQEEPDGLLMPGEWEEGETYAIDDLDNFLGTAAVPTHQSETMLDFTSSNRLHEPEQAIDTSQWEEGETYAIDLDDLGNNLSNSAHFLGAMDLGIAAPTQVFSNFGDLDRSTAPIDVTGGDNIETSQWEEGETYAIDLDDLGNSAHLLGEIDLEISATAHLLENRIDARFLPANGDDGADFDPDTQTSTDIHGYGQSETLDPTPVYDENATNTSLMAAVLAGDVDLAGQAVEARASLDGYDWNLGYSPLGMAIDRGHIDLVQFLLDAGANPHNGSLTTTALGLAAERGEVEMIQLLLPRGIDVNQPVGQDAWTALLSAIKHGHRAVVQLLVTAGANVNIWSCGETPILFAAKCEEREIYNYLYPLVNTAIRLCADRDGEQLLQTSHKRRIRAQNRPVEKLIEMATAGNIYEVNRAIEFEIDIDAIGAQGHNALMAAAYYGHRSVIKALLAAGADSNLLSDGYEGLGYGMTALMLVAGSFFASNRHLVAQQLIAAGADLNQRGVGGKTAIMYAATAGPGYRTCVETLIAAGADLDLRDDRGHTVLTLVATAENYPMFNLLLQAGAATEGLESIQLIQAATIGNLNRVQSLLSTKVNLDLDLGAAIGNAAAAGHSQIVDLLIRAGANVNLINNSGFTPIASAAHAGYGEIVQLLISAGADIQAPAGISHSYSALEYAQMGMYQFVGTAAQQDDRGDRQHAQIVRLLEQLEAQ